MKPLRFTNKTCYYSTHLVQKLLLPRLIADIFSKFLTIEHKIEIIINNS